MHSQQRIAAVKILVCDVDGVLTDGAITYGSGNQESKTFNIKDGLGIKLAGWSGLPVVWLTGRSSEAVARRAAELDVQVYQGAQDKEAGLRAIARDRGLGLEEVAYIGDDLNDLPALRIAGLSIAVADAAPELLTVADVITRAPGGRGAVREAVEYILRGQHRWDAAIDTYLVNSRGTQAAQ